MHARGMNAVSGIKSSLASQPLFLRGGARGGGREKESGERMSRRRRRRSVELPMPALGHVVLPHTSKIKPYTARGHYLRSCKDLCETQLCVKYKLAFVLADLRGTAKVFHIRYKPKGVR